MKPKIGVKRSIELALLWMACNRALLLHLSFGNISESFVTKNQYKTFVFLFQSYLKWKCIKKPPYPLIVKGVLKLLVQRK